MALGAAQLEVVLELSRLAGVIADTSFYQWLRVLWIGGLCRVTRYFDTFLAPRFNSYFFSIEFVVEVYSGRRDGLFLPGEVDAAMAAVVARVRDKFEAHILRPASSVPDELRGAVVSHFSKILDEFLTPVAEQLHGGAL